MQVSRGEAQTGWARGRGGREERAMGEQAARWRLPGYIVAHLFAFHKSIRGIGQGFTILNCHECVDVGFRAGSWKDKESWRHRPQPQHTADQADGGGAGGGRQENTAETRRAQRTQSFGGGNEKKER